MKFVCSQSVLAKAVGTVSRAVSVKTTMPVLKGILLSVKDDVLTLTSSNLDLSLETTLDVQASEEGAAVVNARLFGDIIRKLPNAMVKAELDKAGNLNISCLGSEFSLVSLPAEDFPSIGIVEADESLSIGREMLAGLIEKTSFAASIDEKKGVLVGCLLKLTKDHIEMAALDGFRLAVAREAVISDKEKSVIIPARSLSEISKVLSESVCDDVLLVTDSRKAEIRCDSTRIIARLLEGEFIKYADIIPKSYKTKLTVNRSELMSSIERASLLAKEGKNNLIKLSVGSGSVLINSRSEEGNVNEAVDAEIEGDDIVIGFNSKYINDALKVCGDEEVSIEMTSPVSASLIKPVEGDRYTYLVLPVRINAY